MVAPLDVPTVVSVGDEVFSARGLVLVGLFLLVDGYLVRFREMTALIIWTSPERAGLSKSRLARIVGTYVLAISAVTFVCAGVIVLGVSASAVELLYYGLVAVIVVVQSIHVRLG